MGRNGFSLAGALKDAVGFVPKGVSTAWLALGLAFGASVIPSSVFPAIGLHGLVFLPLLVAAFFALMAEGALYRLALFNGYARAEGLGFGGLQFAKPELRLIGAGVLTALFIVFVGALLAVVIAIGLNMAGLITPDMVFPHDLLRYHGKATLGVVAGVVFCAISLFYLVFRLSLYKAATIASHQVVSLNALGPSEGQAFKLFMGVFILTLPVILLVGLLLSPQGLRFVSETASPVIGLASVILKAVAVFIVMPALCGFFASAYRQTLEVRGKE